MKIGKFFLLLCLGVLTLSSCGRYQEISVNEVREVELRSVRGRNIKLACMVKIDNPTGRSFMLKDANLELFRNGYHFANVRNIESVKVLSKSANYYPLDIEIQLSSILSGLALTDLEKLNLEEFTVSGKVKVTSSLYCKNIKFDEISLKQFVEMLK